MNNMRTDTRFLLAQPWSLFLYNINNGTKSIYKTVYHTITCVNGNMNDDIKGVQKKCGLF